MLARSKVAASRRSRGLNEALSEQIYPDIAVVAGMPHEDVHA